MIPNAKYQSWTAFLVVVLIGIYFSTGSFKEFPSGIHAWAQADHYALAKGFVRNDLNFFKPETNVLNHQFPYDFKVPAEQSITAVDFPLHHYLVAVVMKLADDGSPIIFRIYVFIYSLIGLFFLFNLVKNFSGRHIFATGVTVFAASSPLFLFYQNGFLPTIPSLANALIGIFFYSKFISENENRFFNLSILFLTLAALSRTTFAIPLIAVLCSEFLRIRGGRSVLKNKLLAVLLSFSAILFFVWYNAYLRGEYGSIFLNSLMPASSYQDISITLSEVWTRWITHYFSVSQYVFLFMATGVFLLLSRKLEMDKTKTDFIRMTGIMLFGCILFTFLMFKQFADHDYYFLDTYFLPIVLVLTCVLSALPVASDRRKRGITLSLLLGFSFFFIVEAETTLELRRSPQPWKNISKTIDNFREASRFLDSLGVPKDSKLLIVGAFAPNIPLVLSERKGYALMRVDRENLLNVLVWDYDYVVFQNEHFLAGAFAVYPEIISSFDVLGDNGRITVAVKRLSSLNRNLKEFHGWDKEPPVLSEAIDFESAPSGHWENIRPVDDEALSGTRSSRLSPSMSYGLIFRSREVDELRKRSSTLFLSAQILPDSIVKSKWGVSITEDGQSICYDLVDISDHIDNERTWQGLDLTFPLPQVKGEECEFSVFILNDGGASLYIDDFSFEVY